MVKEVINEATEPLRPSLLGDIMQCRMADGYWCLGTACWSHLQCLIQSWRSLTGLKEFWIQNPNDLGGCQEICFRLGSQVGDQSFAAPEIQKPGDGENIIWVSRTLYRKHCLKVWSHSAVVDEVMCCSKKMAPLSVYVGTTCCQKGNHQHVLQMLLYFHHKCR